jgi:hypothetical protein
MPDTIQGCNVAVAINCMFEDEVEPGLKLSFQLAHNLLPAASYLRCCLQQATYDILNAMPTGADTGECDIGFDDDHNMVLWSLPASGWWVVCSKRLRSEALTASWTSWGVRLSIR